jgi:hypothetical protein
LCVLEVLRPSKKHPEDKNRSILLGLVFLGGLASVVTGLMLNQEGGYSESRIAWHMWLGITMTVVVGITFGFSCILLVCKHVAPYYRVCLAVSTILMIAGAHHGGVLTHGRHFLTEYLPFAGKAPVEQALSVPEAVPDSGQFSFAQHVWPILEARCIECHNEEKMKADLRLDSPEWIMKGAKFGPVVVPGDPDDSSFYYLTTYPEDDEDRMPSDGDPLTPEQIEILRKWIEQGAVF